MGKRSSGILLHITSLPSPYGIGDLGPFAYSTVDFLKVSGQKFWQILPINPTDGINGHSPYSCFSAFAGNPLIISPQMMVIDGFLSPKDLQGSAQPSHGDVDYAKASTLKQKLFNLAFKSWAKNSDKADYDDFCQKNKAWLDDYAVFVAAKEEYKGRCWNQWPALIRTRQAKALAKFTKEHASTIERAKLIQYIFFVQWQKFKKYANENGISIIGDIPIYVNYDSVEVWCHPSYFKLEADGALKFVSGCPPDYFSKTGQRWGNPVYDWAKLKHDKYRWWASRIGHNLELFDVLRIDHFRGFSSFWQIPAHEKLAVFGRWVKGPGPSLFKALQLRFKNLPLIAEDLGEITPDVTSLMRQFKFPGMRVLLFGFGGDVKTNPHVPANFPIHSVVYTGTHDNNTIQGWYRSEAKPHEKARIAKVLGVRGISAKNIHWSMIQALFASKANLAIVPMADVLGLKAESRMNTPATKVNNWKWRFNERLLTKDLAKKIFHLTRQSNRV